MGGEQRKKCHTLSHTMKYSKFRCSGAGRALKKKWNCGRSIFSQRPLLLLKEIKVEEMNVSEVEVAPMPTTGTPVPAEMPTLMRDDVLEDLKKLENLENILDLQEADYPQFTLAKNKARFLRMLTWYKNKETWLLVAPLSGVKKLFKQQSKELDGVRANKLDYEMELETGTLTPSQRSYRSDELKMCKVHEMMAVHLISKMQIKIKSGRR